MKIAVFSDTHGFSRGMINAVEEYKPDQVIHLGDGMNDAEKVREMFPQIPVCCVPGNCDGYYDDEEAYKLITLGSLKAFLTHGHRYAVRGGKLDVLLYAAECCGAQIAHVRAHAQGTFRPDRRHFRAKPRNRRQSAAQDLGKARDHARRHGKLRYLRYRLLVYKKS